MKRIKGKSLGKHEGHCGGRLIGHSTPSDIGDGFAWCSKCKSTIRLFDRKGKGKGEGSMKPSDFKVGDQIEFLDTKKGTKINKGVVIGHDTEDRVLVRWEYHDGIFGEGSVQMDLVFPKKIEKVMS